MRTQELMEKLEMEVYLQEIPDTSDLETLTEETKKCIAQAVELCSLHLKLEQK